jgi:hypothetical protein
MRSAAHCACCWASQGIEPGCSSHPGLMAPHVTHVPDCPVGLETVHQMLYGGGKQPWESPGEFVTYCRGHYLKVTLPNDALQLAVTCPVMRSGLGVHIQAMRSVVWCYVMRDLASCRASRGSARQQPTTATVNG